MSKKKVNSVHSVNQKVALPAKDSHKAQKNTIYYILFLFIATFLLYAWTAKFSWGLDDISYIYEPIKKIENNWNGIATLFAQRYGRYDYRPITLLAFYIENTIFGDLYPGKSHLINVFLFALINIQIFRFIVAAEFYEDKNKNYALALLTAFLFLIHPVHVSVVANIKSRDNLLSMLFGLTATMQFIFYFKDKKWKHIPIIIMMESLALLSKLDSYVFLIIPVLYYIFYQISIHKLSDLNNKKNWILLAKFVLVVFLVNLIINIFESSFTTPVTLSKAFQDTPLEGNDTILNRLSLSFTTLLYYLKFMVIPHGYYFYFGYNQIPLTPLWSLLNLLSITLYITLFLLALKHFKKDKIYLFSLLFFLLSIAYAANFFVTVSGILMDRYSFIASLGFVLGCSAVVLNLTKINNWHIIHYKFLIPVYAILIAATVYRTAAWENLFTLFNRDIKSLNKSAHANAVVGGIYINDAMFGNYTKEEKSAKILAGEQYIDKALKIGDKDKFAFESKALCKIFFNKDREAIPYLNKAIQVDSNYTGPYNNLGLAYRNISEIDSALIYFGIGMNRDILYSYPAINYVQMLIAKQRYSSVDSTLTVLQSRFPNDQHLNQDINNWKQHNKWVQW